MITWGGATPKAPECRAIVRPVTVTEAVMVGWWAPLPLPASGSYADVQGAITIAVPAERVSWLLGARFRCEPIDVAGVPHRVLDVLTGDIAWE